jgi:hypothetical protein
LPASSTSAAISCAGAEATDALKAQALKQEVLFYTRQNLTDIQTQQAVCVNGYLPLDVLKRRPRARLSTAAPAWPPPA